MAVLTAPLAPGGTLRRVSVSVVVAGYAGAVVAVAFAVRAEAWGSLGATLLSLVWLVAASLAVRARPEHPGALLFACLGAGHLVGFALGLPLSVDPGLNGWGAWSLNLVAGLFYVLGFAALALFLATYPTGRPHTVVERWFRRVVVPVAVLVTVAENTTANPIDLVVEAERGSLPAPPGLPLVETQLPASGVLLLLVVMGAVLLVVRGRRAIGVERRQLSWAAGAGGLLALMLLIAPVLGRVFPPVVTDLAFLVVVSVIPFVLLAGLVRYRLIDVDVYVARTLALGSVIAIVLAAYALVAAVSADNRGATAALVVFAALTGGPLLRLVSRGVDRLFSGGRVRGQALLKQLADSLMAADQADVSARTTAALAAGLEVAWVRLEVAGQASVSGAGAHGGARQEPSLRVPLLAAGHQIGVLECGPRHGGWTPTEVEEVQLIAHHAALALHNAELSTRLARQVEELQASRLRIVRGELEVRRRLERDLHDGVQQQVVALIAHLGALRVMVDAGSPAAEIVETAHRQAALCLRDLRAVVGGVHPPVLLDQGVAAAVESRVTLLPVPVAVQSCLDDRYAAETEAAAYYVVSEALTNVVKHAAASRAEVVLAPGRDGELCVRVRDDGVGMPAERAARGLNSLRDRVEALSGELVVESGPGGTCVSVRLPAQEEVSLA